MKKSHIIIFLSIITTIAYLDLVDSCRKLDSATSKKIELSQDDNVKINYRDNDKLKVILKFLTINNSKM